MQGHIPQARSALKAYPVRGDDDVQDYTHGFERYVLSIIGTKPKMTTTAY